MFQSGREVVRTDHVLTVLLGDSVDSVCEKMNSRATRCAVVISETGELAGIFTPRDAALALATGADAGARPVRAAMTRRPITLRHGADAGEASRLMREGGFSHLPVVSRGHVTAVFADQS
jgi:CBS domain-containing protein